MEYEQLDIFSYLQSQKKRNLIREIGLKKMLSENN